MFPCRKHFVSLHRQTTLAPCLKPHTRPPRQTIPEASVSAAASSTTTLRGFPYARSILPQRWYCCWLECLWVAAPQPTTTPSLTFRWIRMRDSHSRISGPCWKALYFTTNEVYENPLFLQFSGVDGCQCCLAQNLCRQIR